MGSLGDVKELYGFDLRDEDVKGLYRNESRYKGSKKGIIYPLLFFVPFSLSLAKNALTSPQENDKDNEKPKFNDKWKGGELTPDGWVIPNRINKNAFGKYSYDLKDPNQLMLAYYEAIKNNDKNLLGYLVSDGTIKLIKENWNMSKDEFLEYWLEKKKRIISRNFKYSIIGLFEPHPDPHDRRLFKRDVLIYLLDDEGNRTKLIPDEFICTEVDGKWQI